MDDIMKEFGISDNNLRKMAHAGRVYQRNKQHVEANLQTMSVEECIQSCKTQDALYLISIGERGVV